MSADEQAVRPHTTAEAGRDQDGTDAESSAPTTRQAGVTSERAALWVFVAYLVVAVPVLLWLGSYRWFFGDEWSFIADRSIDADGLFRAHNQHWSTGPVLAWRGLYSLFGLETYTPYQFVVIVLHLATAGLLRVVMRRADVGPWIATVAAGAFVLLGPAEDNILWAFQIGFTGTLVLGLVQLLLADHDGPIDRRDWIGLGVGFVALTMSGQAPPLVLAVGVVCLLRRRRRAAAFHTIPLGLAYVAWFVATNVEPVAEGGDRTFGPGVYLDWMADTAEGLFIGLGYTGVIAVALLVMFVVGVVVAWQAEGRSLLRRAAIPTALLVALVVSASAAAPSRFALGEDHARASRYIGVAVALALPAMAVAADAIARRWRFGLPVVLALFLVPLPFNAAVFGTNEILTDEYYDNLQLYTTALAEHPLATEVPPWVRPNESLVGQPDMTIGWLLQAEANGELPEPSGTLDPFAASLVPLQLGVATVDDEPITDGLRCESHEAAVPLDPEVGDRLAFETEAQVASRTGNEPSSLWLAFPASTVEITLPDLHLLVAPLEGETEVRLCR